MCQLNLSFSLTLMTISTGLPVRSTSVFKSSCLYIESRFVVPCFFSSVLWNLSSLCRSRHGLHAEKWGGLPTWWYPEGSCPSWCSCTSPPRAQSSGTRRPWCVNHNFLHSLVLFQRNWGMVRCTCTPLLRLPMLVKPVSTALLGEKATHF